MRAGAAAGPHMRGIARQPKAPAEAALAPAHDRNSRITQSAHMCGQVGGHGSRYTERTVELVEAGRIVE